MKSLKNNTRSLALAVLLGTFCFGCGGGSTPQDKPSGRPQAADANPQQQANDKAQQHADKVNKKVR